MDQPKSAKVTEMRRGGRHWGRGTNADEVSVVEAAYRIGGDETEWLRGLAEAAAPLIDEGLGVVAVHVELAPACVHLRGVATVGGSPLLFEAYQTFMSTATPELLLLAFSSRACETFSSAVGGAHKLAQDPAAHTMFRLGVRDSMRILGSDGRHQVSIAAWLPQPSPRLSRLVLSRWNRVASHLNAGLRLRRELARVTALGPGEAIPMLGGEAILTPTGRVEHAEGPAQLGRSSLAQAVVAMNRARGKLRTDDPDAALDAWKGLVAGRWSLIEHVETDGRRYLVARKNDPRVPGPRGVSLRERQILAARARGLTQKLIAYDLGLSVATVSRSLQNGMSKLGLSCESDLVALFATSRYPSDTDPP